VSKIATLSAQIAEAEQTLAYARDRHRIALEALALRPGDPTTLSTARKTGVEVANAEGDLKLLNDSHGAAVAADQVDDEKARRLGAVAHLRQAVQLSARRDAAGAALDKAMQALDRACKEWIQVNGGLGRSVVDFFRAAQPGNSQTDLRIMLSDFERTPANPLLSQFDAAVQGIVPRSAMALQFTTSYGEPELIAPEVKRTGDRIVALVQGTAEVEGLPL